MAERAHVSLQLKQEAAGARLRRNRASRCRNLWLKQSYLELCRAHSWLRVQQLGLRSPCNLIGMAGWMNSPSSQLTEEEKKAALPPGVQSQLRSQAQPLGGVSVSEEPSFTVTQSQNKQSLELLFQTREEWE